MLLLPWLVGAIWMLWLDSVVHPCASVNWAKIIGYGFFVGASILAPLVYVSFTIDQIAPPLVLIAGALLLIMLLGVMLVWYNYRQGCLNFAFSDDVHTPATKVLLAVLTFLMLLHIGLAALDVFSRPVFPWDAWTTWVYRAKVWYLSGTIAPMQSSAEWLASGGDGYVLTAHFYPKTVSLLYLWPALVTGIWDDGLAVSINWLASIAIALALYGQIRAVGYSVLAATLSAYLFLSMPLINAHMALGGYADLFVAGFAGLGMVSLLCWAKARLHWAELVFGLLLLAVSVMVKREGAVWLVVGVVFLLSQLLSWRWLLLSLLALAIAWLSGLHAINLPGIGLLGIDNGVLHVPYVGVFPMHFQGTLNAISGNLLLNASWSLLFYILPIGLLLGFWFNKPAFKVVAPLIILIAMTMVAIFVFSPEARWALDNTAINRVLMQMLPALLMALVVLWHPGVSPPGGAD